MVYGNTVINQLISLAGDKDELPTRLSEIHPECYRSIMAALVYQLRASYKALEAGLCSK
jgi:hypothetical protein